MARYAGRHLGRVSKDHGADDKNELARQGWTLDGPFRFCHLVLARHVTERQKESGAMPTYEIPAPEPRAHLSTMYAAERHITLPSHTNDGGEVQVPYLVWHPGATKHPCEAELLDPKAIDNTTRVRCGREPEDDFHQHLEFGNHHEYLASHVQPGMYLTLDNRLGYNIPTTITPYEADALVEFLANAIAIGAGYPSIYYTKRKMPFRG